MSFPNWIMEPKEVFSISKIIPVIVIEDISIAIPLAKALFAKGINILEITLRTPVALEALQLLTDTFPEAMIGAGTIINVQQLHAVIKAGAKFAISPGHTASLLKAGKEAHIPLIPGVASVSDLMEGMELGYTHFKFFPAVAAGGIPMLKAMNGPFPKVRFCPTGGITESNHVEYLALPNVDCVGGSWVVPEIVENIGLIRF